MLFRKDAAWEAMPDVEQALANALSGPSSPKMQRAFGVEAGARLRVIEAHRLKLPFYNRHHLCRLTIAPRGAENAYQSAAAYALVGDHPDPAGKRDSHLLNGQSFVILQTNRSYWSRAVPGRGLAIAPEDDKTWLDYLDFHLTFVARNQNPYMLLQSARDLLDSEPALKSAREAEDAPQITFTRLLADRRERLFDAEHAIELTLPNVEAYLDGKLTQQDLAERAATEREAATIAGIREILADKIQPPSGRWNEQDKVYEATGALLFDRSCYQATFKIKPNGDARITESELVLGDLLPTKPLFHPRHPSLLVQQKERADIDAESFRAELMALDKRDREESANAEEIEGAAPTRRDVAPAPDQATADREFRNLRINGDLDLSSLTFERALEWDDVQIIGDLILSDAHFKSSLHLKSLNVAGRLRAENMRCEAQIALPDLTVHGLHDRDRERENVSQLSESDDVSVGASFKGGFIEGGFDLSRATVYGGLNLEELDVKGGVDLSGVRVERRAPTDVTRAPFGLSLRGANVGRDVTLAAAQTRVSLFEPPRVSRIAGDLRLSGADIGGRLLLNELVTTPRRHPDRRLCAAFNDAAPAAAQPRDFRQNLLERVEAGDVRVFFRPQPDEELAQTTHEPMLVLTPRPSADPLAAGALDLREASVKRSAEAKQIKIAGNIDFSSANIDESFYLNHAETRNGGALLGAAAQISGHLLIGGASIDGGVDVTAARIKGRMDGDPIARRPGGQRDVLRVKGDVTASGAVISSDLRLSAAEIKGDFLAVTGSFGRIRLRPAMTANRTLPRRTQIRAIRLQSVDAISLDLSGVVVRCQQDAPTHRDQGCVFLHSVSLREGLRLFSEDLVYLMKGDPEWEPPSDLKASDFGARIGSRFETRQLRAGGDVVLTHAQIEGPAELVHAQIGGDLLAEPRLKKGDPNADPVAEETLRMTAYGLDLRLTQCFGDADLSGMTLMSAPHQGDLEARGARFSGAFNLVDGELLDERIHHTRRELPYAKIGGRIDLSGLTAESVGVSGASLRDAVTKARMSEEQKEIARNLGEISLERATIGRITLVEPLPDRPDIADLEVRKWEYFDPEKGERASSLELRDRLSTLLSRSLPFNRAIYAGIERFLRDVGDDTAADKVYRQMRWREIRPSKLRARRTLWPLQRKGEISVTWPEGGLVTLFLFLTGQVSRAMEALWSTTIGVLTSFWTRGWRLIISINIVLLPLSFLILTERQNIAPSTFQLSESRADVSAPGGAAAPPDGAALRPKKLSRKSMPDEDQWQGVEKMRLIAQTHVPIVPLLISPRWVPAENRELCVYDPLRAVDAWWPTWALANPLPAAWPRDPAPEPAPAPETERVECDDDALRVPDHSAAAYALIVRTLHWIAWPLALAGVAARMQRRRTS